MGDVPKRHAPILFPSDQETRTGDGKKRKTDEFPRTPVPRRNAGDARPRRDDVICPKPSLPKHSNTNPKSSSRDGFKSAAKGFEPQKDVPFEKPADRQIGKSGLQVRVVFDKSHRWTRDEVREQGESVVYQQGLLPNLAELVSLNLTESERRLLIWHFRICCFCHDEIPVEARAGCHSYNCGCLAHQFGHDGCSSSERTSSAVTHSAQLCTLEFQNRLISDFIKKKISSEADDDVEKCINAEMRASFPNLTSGFSKRFDSSEELVGTQQKRGETAKRSMARESKKSMTMAIGAKPTVPQRTVMKKVEGTVDDCVLISSDSEAELCPPEKKKRMEKKPTVESREETEIDLVLLRALNEEVQHKTMNSSLYVQCLSISLLLLLVGRGLCDDRQMGWNKAHGLWGKRSGNTQQEVYNQHKRPENWAKLNTLWGKRSEVEPLTNYGEWSKRAQWQMANGLWGR